MTISKANLKIQGAKIHYDIYALRLWLRDTTFRVEHEEKVSGRTDLPIFCITLETSFTFYSGYIFPFPMKINIFQRELKNKMHLKWKIMTII